TPIALAAARAAWQQASARYRAALSTITSVADAQRVLAQADLEHAIARIEVLRALVLLARAGGDLSGVIALGRTR
ncbi:MAG: TolC family protein, partial [Myxococcales bacterium]|nr:TolC family protein [Myxococcales bacterium]